MISESDLKHLARCVELAKIALEEGNQPFGSILVSAEGEVLHEERSQVSGGDFTRHPEFELARWAANNMTPEARSKATVYTTAEHCPMCSAAHGWVGLGRIVYASSSKQVLEWRHEFGAKPGKVRSLSIEEVIRDTPVDGPVPELAAELRELQRLSYGR